MPSSAGRMNLRSGGQCPGSAGFQPAPKRAHCHAPLQITLGKTKLAFHDAIGRGGWQAARRADATRSYHGFVNTMLRVNGSIRRGGWQAALFCGRLRRAPGMRASTGNAGACDAPLPRLRQMRACNLPHAPI